MVTKSASQGILLYSEYQPGEYFFINRADHSFTVTVKHVKRFKTPKKQIKTQELRLHERITVTLKKPASMHGIPVINIFVYTKTSYDSRHTLRNSTSFHTILARFTSSQLKWVLQEFLDLLDRNNVPYDFSKALQWAATSFRYVDPHNKAQIIEPLIFPLVQHLANSKVASAHMLPIFRARSFEDILLMFPLSNDDLIAVLKEKYDNSSFTYSDLFFFSIAHKVFSEEQILEILKIDIGKAASPWTFYKKSDVSTLRAVLSKVDFNGFKEQWVSLLKEKPYPENLAQPTMFKLRPSSLHLWSRNYRKIKSVKKKMPFLSEENVIAFLEENYITISQEKVDVDVSQKMESLKLPVKGEPNVYFTFIKKRGKSAATIKYLKENHWLYGLITKYAGPSAPSSVIFDVHGEVSLYEFLAELEGHILSYFTRTNIPYSKKVAYELLQAILILNMSSHYPKFKGKVPLTVMKLVATGMPFWMAFNLIVNGIAYKEIAALFVKDGEYSGTPESHLYMMFDIDGETDTVYPIIKSMAPVRAIERILYGEVAVREKDLDSLTF